MRIFVTGSSGFIGSAVVPELIAAGHRVLGLARSEAAARTIGANGADVLRGDLNDLDSLRRGAAESEGVIHLGFVHDFDHFDESVRTDLRAIETIAGALEGSNRPFVIASGTAGLLPGRLATEATPFNPKVHPRAANAVAALGFKERAVRVSIVRLAPTVHDKGDHGFVPTLIEIARKKGISGYIGDGTSRWSAVHRLDAAQLFRLAVEKAAPGSILHAVADESVQTRSIAEIIGRKLGLPVSSVAADAAGEHFGWIGRFFAMDQPASSAITREQMGWAPKHLGLIEDLEQGHYFERSAAVEL